MCLCEQRSKRKLHANRPHVPETAFRGSRQPRSRRHRFHQFDRIRAHDGRSRAILDRLDSRTVAIDEDEEQAGGLTNIRHLVVRVGIVSQIKVARVPTKLPMGASLPMSASFPMSAKLPNGVGALTRSVSFCGKSGCHDRRKRSRQILTIGKKS